MCFTNLRNVCASKEYKMDALNIVINRSKSVFPSP